MKFKPNDPAEPCEMWVYSGNAQLGDIKHAFPGFTKREKLAAMLAQAQIQNGGTCNPELVVKTVDHLIKALERE